LDTKTQEGKEVLEKMIKTSDVMVENFGPGALDRMGFSWKRIQELNPKMIMASNTLILDKELLSHSRNLRWVRLFTVRDGSRLLVQFSWTSTAAGFRVKDVN